MKVVKNDQMVEVLGVWRKFWCSTLDYVHSRNYPRQMNTVLVLEQEPFRSDMIIGQFYWSKNLGTYADTWEEGNQI